MRTSMKGLMALALFSVSAPVFAQEAEADPPSDFTVTGGVTVVSDYRFRGVSFSAEDFAIQGTFNVNHSSGLYLGVWGSSIDDTPVFGHTELDIYAGYTTEIASGTAIDVGLLYYYYPNGELGASDYFEPYASIKTTIGPVSAKLGAAYAFDQSALAGDNIYVYTDLGLAIPDTPVTLAAHLGYSDGSLAFGGNYFDWSLGADFALGSGLTAGVRYVDTDLDDLTGIPAADTLYDETVLFTLGVAF
jgi:uncharacterized protein (TIGR02001 family)